MFVNRSEPRLAHLEWRIRLFGAGGLLALVGILADQGWLVDVAIVVLVIGFALRFVGRNRSRDADADYADADQAGADDVVHDHADQQHDVDGGPAQPT